MSYIVPHFTTRNGTIVAARSGTRQPNRVKRARRTTRVQTKQRKVVRRSRTTVRRKKQSEVQGGDYTQFTESHIKSGKYNKLSLRNLSRYVKAQEEPLLLRWNGVKNFDDYGYHPCGRDTSDATYTRLPLYMFDLTSTINSSLGSYTAASPLFRLQIVKASGTIAWQQISGLQADGATTSTEIQYEKNPTYSTLTSSPYDKSLLKWTDVRLNLWGAKNKAIKYTIAIVKLLDPDLDPYEQTYNRSTNNKHSAHWQQVIKPYTFNPVSSTGAGLSKRIKVLKTFTKIIQPTTSTENDVDPHAHILKWFMKWDRMLSYKESPPYITTATDLISQADFSTSVARVSTRADPKQKLWLMVTASAYSDTVGFDAATAASFDLSVRTCHIPQL